MAAPHRQLRRYEGQHHARYLTCSCCKRLPLFRNDCIKEAFVEHLCLVQREMQFELFAWVVMPEHIHLMLRPVGALNETRSSEVTTTRRDQTVTQILRRLKAPFGKRIVSRWRELNAPILAQITDSQGQPRFWQPGGGYDRNVFSDEEFREKLTYIHANPVRRGLTKSADEYRWSSARFYASPEAYVGPVLMRMVSS